MVRRHRRAVHETVHDVQAPSSYDATIYLCAGVVNPRRRGSKPSTYPLVTALFLKIVGGKEGGGAVQDFGRHHHSLSSYLVAPSPPLLRGAADLRGTSMRRLSEGSRLRVIRQPNSLSVNWITELQDSSSSAESQDIGRGQSRTSRKQTSGSRKPSGAFRPLGRQHARSGTGPSERGVLGPAAESGRDRFGRRERRALAGSYRSRQASGDVVSAASAMRRAVSVRRAAYDESIQPCTPR